MPKVRIKRTPRASQGAEVPGGNMFFNAQNLNNLGTHDQNVSRTLKPVKRDDANIEAEKGEVAVTNLNGSDAGMGLTSHPSMGDGIPETYIIGGKRHAQGGTPLDLPEGSFIYSDYKTGKKGEKGMKISDPDTLLEFGIKNHKKGHTPASIAKKYNLNEYKKTLLDDSSDDISRTTAEIMIGNYVNKLGQLALVQESTKGFKQGIPDIAMPYLQMNNIDPNSLLPKAQQGGQIQQPQMPMARYGAYIPRAQRGYFSPEQREIRRNLRDDKRFNRYITDLYKDQYRDQLTEDYYSPEGGLETKLRSLGYGLDGKGSPIPFTDEFGNEITFTGERGTTPISSIYDQDLGRLTPKDFRKIKRDYRSTMRQGMDDEMDMWNRYGIDKRATPGYKIVNGRRIYDYDDYFDETQMDPKNERFGLEGTYEDLRSEWDEARNQKRASWQDPLNQVKDKSKNIGSRRKRMKQAYIDAMNRVGVEDDREIESAIVTNFRKGEDGNWRATGGYDYTKPEEKNPNNPPPPPPPGDDDDKTSYYDMEQWDTDYGNLNYTMGEGYQPITINGKTYNTAAEMMTALEDPNEITDMADVLKYFEGVAGSPTAGPLSDYLSPTSAKNGHLYADSYQNYYDSPNQVYNFAKNMPAEYIGKAARKQRGDTEFLDKKGLLTDLPELVNADPAVQDMMRMYHYNTGYDPRVLLAQAQGADFKGKRGDYSQGILNIADLYDKTKIDQITPQDLLTSMTDMYRGIESANPGSYASYANRLKLLANRYGLNLPSNVLSDQFRQGGSTRRYQGPPGEVTQEDDAMNWLNTGSKYRPAVGGDAFNRPIREIAPASGPDYYDQPYFPNYDNVDDIYESNIGTRRDRRRYRKAMDLMYLGDRERKQRRGERILDDPRLQSLDINPNIDENYYRALELYGKGRYDKSDDLLNKVDWDQVDSVLEEFRDGGSIRMLQEPPGEIGPDDMVTAFGTHEGKYWDENTNQREDITSERAFQTRMKHSEYLEFVKLVDEFHKEKKNLVDNYWDKPSYMKSSGTGRYIDPNKIPQSYYDALTKLVDFTDEKGIEIPDLRGANEQGKPIGTDNLFGISHRAFDVKYDKEIPDPKEEPKTPEETPKEKPDPIIPGSATYYETLEGFPNPNDALRRWRWPRKQRRHLALTTPLLGDPVLKSKDYEANEQLAQQNTAYDAARAFGKNTSMGAVTPAINKQAQIDSSIANYNADILNRFADANATRMNQANAFNTRELNDYFADQDTIKDNYWKRINRALDADAMLRKSDMENAINFSLLGTDQFDIRDNAIRYNRTSKAFTNNSGFDWDSYRGMTQDQRDAYKDEYELKKLMRELNQPNYYNTLNRRRRRYPQPYDYNWDYS